MAPYTRDNPIPVFMASDNHYAPILATAMYSILSNTKSFIAFHILDGGISNFSKELLRKTLSPFSDHTLQFIDMVKFDIGRFPSIAHYSVNAFSRFFIPDIVSSQQKTMPKILYLDADIVAVDDITTLFEQDISGYALGAVSDGFYKGNFQNLEENLCPEYKGGDTYFNSGVLLIDVGQFIEHDYARTLIEKTLEITERAEKKKCHCCPDQDALNVLFDGNYRRLHYKYNFSPEYFDLLRRHDPLEAKETLDNPVILHYTGGKPWRGYKGLRYLDFWNAAKETMFCDQFLANDPYASRVFKLFGFLPFCKIEKSLDHYKIRFFGLPILKISYNSNKIKVLLFGVLVLLSIKKTK